MMRHQKAFDTIDHWLIAELTVPTQISLNIYTKMQLLASGCGREMLTTPLEYMFKSTDIDNFEIDIKGEKLNQSLIADDIILVTDCLGDAQTLNLYEGGSEC